MLEAGEGANAKKECINQDCGSHPQKHEHAKEQSCEKYLSASSRADAKHPTERGLLRALKASTLQIKTRRQKWSDDHQTGNNWKEKVIAPGCKQYPYREAAKSADDDAIGQALGRGDQEVAPAFSQPGERGVYGQVSLPFWVPSFFYTRDLTNETPGFVVRNHMTLLKLAISTMTWLP